MPSIKNTFSLKDTDIERIRKSISRVGEISEDVINNYLHNKAGKKITKSITNYIPKSPRKNVIHARGSNWSEQDNYNLAVSISNSLKGKRGTSFYYLYYVATGTGTNEEKGARNFMDKGMDKEYNNIVNGIVEELSTNIEKEMN